MLRLHEDDMELAAQRTSVHNSLQLYTKTRAQPTVQSVRLAKRIEKGVVHPCFGDVYGAEERKRDDILASLKIFRPPTTVFELGAPSLVLIFFILSKSVISRDARVRLQ